MQHFALVALTIGFVRCDGFQYDPQQKWHLSTPRSLTQNINAQSPSKNTYSTNLQRLMDEDSKPGGYGKSAPSAPNPSLTSSNSFGRSLTPAVDRRNAAPRGGSRRRVLTPNRRKATKPSVPGAGTKLEPAVATAYQPVKNIWIPKATPSINFDGSSKPKATAPSDHNDDPKSTETSLTNFSSGLMPKSVSLKTPIYRTNWMMLNLAKTAVPNVGPTLTSQNFYSTNHSKIIPVAHILPPNSQKDRVTMTSESLGNTRSTPDKTTTNRALTGSMDKLIQMMISSATQIEDGQSKLAVAADAAPDQTNADPNGVTYKGRATKSTKTKFRSATV